MKTLARVIIYVCAHFESTQDPRKLRARKGGALGTLDQTMKLAPAPAQKAAIPALEIPLAAPAPAPAPAASTGDLKPKEYIIVE